MSEDVLQSYDQEIAFAEGLHLPAILTPDVCGSDRKWMAIRDLAAELRALRESDKTSLARIARLQETVLGDINTIEVLRMRVTMLEGEKYQLGVLRDAAESRRDELQDENEGLQARMAELEPDAKLGKMVREMPGGASIAREPGQKVRFSAVWPSGTRDKNGWMHYSERCYEDTPGAALEAAQKETP